MTLEDAITTLGRFAADLRWTDVPEQVSAHTSLVLLDTLGVTIAGARTPELVALAARWSACAGPVSVLGAGRAVGAHDAMWLNGIAACCLELDEGNKYAQGHPAAHVVFAVLAEAQTRPVSGAELLSALLVGHEVASRFGRAMHRVAGLHTHGHWGALGAAAAVARLRGAGPDGIAAAVDAAGGLALAAPWESALHGSFVRNMWIGAANVAGTVAATLSAAGLAAVDGTPGLTLGSLLGELRVEQLTEELGERFDITLGYFKRHSSCSYTHPPADAVIELREQEVVDIDRVSRVVVETNELAAPLVRTDVPTRLAAMFSIPFVVAVALNEGAVLPASFDEAHRRDPRILQLMRKVDVRQTAEMTARLPAERAARVSVTLDDGRQVTREVPNPIGDADHHPFGRDEVLHKFGLLIGAPDAAVVADVVDRLPDATDAGSLIPTLERGPQGGAG